MTDSLPALLGELTRHLQATGTLPIEESANRWLGEAEAVATDLTGDQPPPGVLKERVIVLRRLLAEIESTGHPEADAHIDEARDLIETILDSLPEESD